MSAIDRFLRLGCLAALIAIAPALTGTPLPLASAGHTARPWVWPLTPRPAVVNPFDPPDSPYAAGNRGIDLAGSVGQTVLAIGSGVVTYAGVIGGRGVVVVSHGALRSTYEPVSAAVAIGDSVGVGQPVGVLSTVGSHCPPGACLHLGVLRGTQYVDPLSLLGDPPIRLKPLAGEPGSPSGPVAVDPRSDGGGRRVPVAGGALTRVRRLRRGGALAGRRLAAARC